MKVIEILKTAIVDVNKQLKQKDKIPFKKDFQILGPESTLDSLVIVNLFVSIEEKIKSQKRKEISLLNDNIFEKSFKKKYTLTDLEKYIVKKIRKI